MMVMASLPHRSKSFPAISWPGNTKLKLAAMTVGIADKDEGASSVDNFPSCLVSNGTTVRHVGGCLGRVRIIYACRYRRAEGDSYKSISFKR
ncbi:hypothetical protein ACROYT_G013280 [Oculina patagonica]